MLEDAMLKMTMITAALTLAATSCSGGDDPLPGDPDAAVDTTPDASTGAMGIGQVCSQAMPCPASAPTCAVTQMNATVGFCTASCGTTPANSMTPPAGGNAMCVAAYTGGVGTPVCGLGFAPMGQTMTWGCAIACGNFQGNELGGCPGGLTCVANNCTPTL
ncbi:MAG: hypothetical protein KBG28_02750 [Kofleriaceae bacterium]|nr:hypothetical protein [Kofleriaceae bacterium]MBP6838814.1 hypothetical protein [Kofleriaceae bacterium]MBP9202877.1 hypothetical protein [Kofleriaceae bacterium]